jgi:hypothetical protein
MVVGLPVGLRVQSGGGALPISALIGEGGGDFLVHDGVGWH